ncbi:major sperm protein domain-containing protein, putative [Eimeria maxima]|uniref:Major sperm protein domain-containing protein, putative n=1 Tax=Eimeria maxima TaxID=5804 RepID=U6M464_EIMMA|nr:major sperm protein domain-containing protein, putative [Eimeria maxima]CDJ57858.1 major sperm protein domain-containing protein, putative [Eimeria maxima]
MPLLQVHPEKVLEIPFALYSSSVVQLTLRNISPHPYVAYKIKTTAPKNYLVRPSTGAVPQGEARSVQIVLQAMREEPPRTATDRFLVQATPVDNNVPLPRSYWLELPKTDLEETRLSVSFKRTAATAAGSSSNSSNSSSSNSGGAAGVGDPAAPSAAVGDNNTPGGGMPPGPSSTGADEGEVGGVGGHSSSSSSSNSSSSSSSSGGGIGGINTSLGGGGGGGGGGDLRQQYDQLVEYTLAMERHKEELAKENDLLRQQLQQKTRAALFELWCAAGAAGAAGHLQHTWQQ